MTLATEGDNQVRRLALIGCGKTKLNHPAPARDLYTGNLFRAARAHVDSRRYDAWGILSALHGIVHPDTVIEPYDATLHATPRRERNVWAVRVDYQLRCTDFAGCGAWLHRGDHLVIDIYAGNTYTEPLVELWTRPPWTHLPLTINTPHRGLGIGTRLAAFKHADTHASTVEAPPTRLARAATAPAR